MLEWHRHKSTQASLAASSGRGSSCVTLVFTNIDETIWSGLGPTGDFLAIRVANKEKETKGWAKAKKGGVEADGPYRVALRLANTVLKKTNAEKKGLIVAPICQRQCKGVGPWQLPRVRISDEVWVQGKEGEDVPAQPPGGKVRVCAEVYGHFLSAPSHSIFPVYLLGTGLPRP